MAGQRIDIMDLRQLIHLKIKGWSNRKIASHLGVSRNTVNTYIKVFDQRGEDLLVLLEYSDSDLMALFPQMDHHTDAERYINLSKRFATYK
jgi:biotin operon repressor